VHAWCPADSPFGAANGLARPGGALNRSVIATRYALAIEALYEREDRHVHP
jgi:hypothetical protein